MKIINVNTCAYIYNIYFSDENRDIKTFLSLTINYRVTSTKV